MKTTFKILFLIMLTMLLCSCSSLIIKGLPEMLVNLQKSLQQVWQFLIAMSYVLGVCMIAISIMKLKAYGHQTVMMSTHASLGPTLAYFFIGAGLLFLPTLLDIMTVSLWGYGLDTIEGPDRGGNYGDVMVAIVQLIQVFGLIAFIRGWIKLSKIGSHGQPDTLPKGIMHIVGGILAINFMGTLRILGKTLGIEF